MSTLIVGGLLLLGVIAIVALIFVARSEPQTGSTRRRVPAASASTTAVDNRQVSNTTADRAVQAEALTATTQAAQGIPTTTQAVQETMALTRTENAVPVRAEERQFPIANGQFHELSVELHTLHGQAQEIEHRLSILTEMVERIERSRNVHVGIEDEATRPTETSTAP